MNEFDNSRFKAAGMKAVIGAVIAVLLFVAVLGSFYTVNQTERGVVLVKWRRCIPSIRIWTGWFHA